MLKTAISTLYHTPATNRLVFQGFQRRGRELGFETLQIRDYHAAFVEEADVLADGYLCANLPDALPRLVATGKPVVWISAAAGTEAYPHVLVDPLAELRLVWEHFQKEQLPNAGLFVSQDPRDYRHPPRREAFLCEAEARRVTAHEFRGGRHTQGHWTLGGQLLDLRDWLLSLPTPIGIYCGDEEHAIRLRKACDLAGRRCPEDVAIVSGTADPESPRQIGFFFSGVLSGWEAVGRIAAERLWARMQGDVSPPETVWVPPDGLIRGPSSDRRYLNHPLVRRAVLLLEARGFEPVSLDELCETLRVSSTTLNRQFRAATGHSTAQMLRELRLREGIRRLKESDAPVIDISTALGWEYLAHFSRDIKVYSGRTPRELRSGAVPRARKPEASGAQIRRR